MTDIEEVGGIGSVMKQTIAHLTGVKHLHLSFDIDSIDPMYAPGTGTKARGGLTYRESLYICNSLSKTGKLHGMDLVEVNPSLDQLEQDADLHGDHPLIKTKLPTVRLANLLIANALGLTIV